MRANYLYAGLADLVAETGDDELTAVLENLWRDVVDTKLYITGGGGALYDGASPDGSPWQDQISRVHQAYGRAYQLPHTTAHNESCANIGLILWGERMLALTGDATLRRCHRAGRLQQPAGEHQPGRLGVLLHERAAPGARPPYPLRRPGDTGHHPVPPPPPSDERLRERYLSCFCCPPNIARTLARFHERAASSRPRGCSSTCTAAATLDVTDDGRPSLALREDSDYPWGERIAFTVTDAAARRHPAPPPHSGLVVGRDPHRQRRARAGGRARHLHPHRARVAARATWSS